MEDRPLLRELLEDPEFASVEQKLIAVQAESPYDTEISYAISMFHRIKQK